jgi:uncharacterized repeat protein (TIGR01451 family)
MVRCRLNNSLAAGTSATLTIDVRVSASASEKLRNMAEADSIEGDPVQVDLNTSVKESVRLSITKTANLSTVAAGGALEYSVVVINNGPSDATGVNITDTLPGGVSYLSSSCSLPATITESNGVVRCSLANSLASSASATLTIDVLVSASASGPLHNIAEADSTEGEPVRVDLEKPVISPSEGSVSLRIIKTASPNTATAGSTLVYSVVVSNDGPSDATGVNITDTLPGG